MRKKRSTTALSAESWASMALNGEIDVCTIAEELLTPAYDVHELPELAIVSSEGVDR